MVREQAERTVLMGRLNDAVQHNPKRSEACRAGIERGFKDSEARLSAVKAAFGKAVQREREAKLLAADRQLRSDQAFLSAVESLLL